MDVLRIGVTGFRNISPSSVIELPPRALLVAAAPNAFGKTNFLESVAVLLRGKSFRAGSAECVTWGEDSYLLEGEVDRGEAGRHQVAVRYHHPARKIRIEEDGAPTSLVSFYSHYPFVLFLPEDTFLLSRGPVQRRNFLNHVLVANPSYLSALVQYQRVLRQRNASLKKATSEADVASWTALLVEHAEVLWRYRENFVDWLKSQVSEVYASLSGEEHEFMLRLVAGATRPDNFAAELAAVFAVERRLGHTLYGPHRDDVSITTGDNDARAALSRGQMRSLVVALKVASWHYLQKMTGERPLLLLDDVLSELDETRSLALLQNLPNTQTILTCTALPSLLQKRDDVYFLDLRSIITSDKAASEPAAASTEVEVEVEEAQEQERVHA